MSINNSAMWPTPPLPASCSSWAWSVETWGPWRPDELFPRAASEGAAGLEIKSFCLEEQGWVHTWTQAQPGILLVLEYSIFPSVCLLILFSLKWPWICF